MELSRRDLMKIGVLGSATVAIPMMRVAGASSLPKLSSSAYPKPFTTPFAAPPVAIPFKQDDTTDYYDLTMRQANATIVPGFVTPIWGYNGVAPGRTIVASKGRRTAVIQRNHLPPKHPQLGYVPWTSVHLHGSESLPEYDGYASDITMPGQVKTYLYPNSQPSRTQWYHDHGVMHTAPNAYMGLAAQYWLVDDLERSLPVPKDAYDVPLIATDALLATDGSKLFDDNDQSGLFGDLILVNGRPWPLMQVERRKYRFRILNASVTRSYRWRLDSGDPFWVIRTDGGFMPAPQPVVSFRHGVAERYEVVIDFANYPIGRRIVLQNLRVDNDINFTTTKVVMAFDVVSEATNLDNNEIPAVLNPDNPTMALTESQATVRRTFELVRDGGEWTINGTVWADVVRSGFKKVLANPQVETVERWTIKNDSGGWHHPFHIHLIDFK